ncbi:hypothetical protein [Mesorhizobium neociceri]|uniref:Uncharacterized protein n=1 Tax=Mesorhizobium neociceri TaxID=1307853 RepID=A0A838B8I3_9HYPH|nr:hypothetical protein [Mesorhizobium neociceri]MBA1142452.1 hypothetical protein [Mesorhizobium neociceri]
MAILVRKEIDQQLNQPAVPAFCSQMVGIAGTLFGVAKQVGSDKQTDVPHNELATQLQNFCQLVDS